MNCKETENSITFFLNDELSGRELKEFMDHISSCPVCKEELSIQFLVMEGMVSLQDGNNFDLQKELDRHLADAQRKMNLRKWFHILVYTLELAAILAIITVIVLVMAL